VNIKDLIDELAQKPVEQCYVQLLQPAIVNVATARRGLNKVTFVTDQLTPTDVINNTGKVGFVVWVAKDRL
jgi:hypothetical protein